MSAKRIVKKSLMLTHGQNRALRNLGPLVKEMSDHIEETTDNEEDFENRFFTRVSCLFLGLGLPEKKFSDALEYMTSVYEEEITNKNNKYETN
jgi:hypothetical protein